MECSVCKARAASGACAECGMSTCEDCGIQCQRCKTDICPQHVYVTPGGRSFCKECMAKRNEAAAERKQKHREKISGAMKGAIEESVAARSTKEESLSFEALTEGVSAPPRKTTKEPPSAKESEEESAEKESKRTVAQTPPKERELDPDRPILTSSMKSHRPSWPVIPAGLFALGMAYFVYTRVPSLQILVVGGISIAAAFFLGRAYLIHKARSQTAPGKSDARRGGR